MSNEKLSFFDVFKLLTDGLEKWNIVDADSNVEKVVHDSGYWYYSGCGGFVRLRKDLTFVNFDYEGEYEANWVQWLVLGPIGAINTFLVRRK